MKNLKITIIGGGSSYTPELIEGFILRYHELPITELCLVDVIEGAEKLSIILDLTKRMFQRANLNVKVTATYDRDIALPSSDFVITQLRVGGINARIKDEQIAFKHHMLGQETNGLAGFAKAMRTIPVILAIAKDMERLCPNAWLINFTNPAGIITEAVLNHSFIKTIGLCNVPVNMHKAVSRQLGSDNFFMQITGLNHYVWGHKIVFEGEEQLQSLLPKLMMDDSFNPKNIGNTPYAIEQILGSGLMPCYYHSYFYMQGDMYNHAYEDFKEHGTRGEIVKKVETELFEIYRDQKCDKKPPQLENRGGAYYSEAACELVNAIYNDKNSLMVVDVLNNGILCNLPDNAVIETTSLITSSGAIPLPVNTLTETALGELSILKSYERLVISASLENSYAKALHALTIHPLIQSGSNLRTALDEIQKANDTFFRLN